MEELLPKFELDGVGSLGELYDGDRFVVGDCDESATLEPSQSVVVQL